MIPLAIPNLAGNEARYLQECIDTTFVSSVGPFVSRFEEMVAHAAGGRHAVATSSGTTGLHAALTAVGVQRDDLVVLPSMTFIASANAIAHCGATPWLFDITSESWTLDPDLLEDTFAREVELKKGGARHKQSNQRVGAIMPVYTLGLPADMDPIVAIADRYGIPIIADAAAALGATYRARMSAATGATLTVYSFNGNKTVTAGGGGAVVTDDPRLAEHTRHLTTTARRGAEYDHDMVGFNYRMTNIQAAVGCAQLELLDGFVASKRRIAARYTAELACLPCCKPFPSPEWAESACWFSGIVVEDRPVAEILSVIRDHGVDARPFWKPIHLQTPYAEAPRTVVPRCEELWSHVLTLPCSTGLSDAEQTQVIAVVKACIG